MRTRDEIVFEQREKHTTDASIFLLSFRKRRSELVRMKISVLQSLHLNTTLSNVFQMFLI